ncbi:putative papain-like cysteine peptidase superfamily [Helianthus annuus]|uniref:Papain-like cysteine peptidase superfamily n=1 Tax=Helianthus annuus TaxID=4232 RepID=A0A9K3N9V6_HELAN|nr:uncharacterized protein LOC110879403 isoform X2 [Helianthus annuus]XP_021983549.1 uncharacterized protein LOC110879403 isoform X2 [Helianthus annuus]XP_035833697.1 uncharacterized protein LOC110879403 isoform X2 [Helianthus annuus]XP_035833698.1 uncharacterized protein LOC110879403 isoform X2 [Helianthus annuus]XP_035833699.1 uncharacterized protein LOC110879403 isoform X2 [Helianthus annuus]XP_035833700.1 uncharacterized protein LOC110879403 isoform X2 [Helianthus annuus]KAF5792274.1 puta
MATARTRWAIVMSRGAGFSDQVVEPDLLYPNEGMHKRWDAGYRITLTASTSNQAAFVLSIREENLQMIHRTHFALLCFLAHMSRAMAMYASQSGANIRVKLIWINARCPRQPGGTECGYYVMNFMKEIAYEAVEILDNDNVGKGVEEYSAADMDGICEDWSTYAVNSIFKL